MKTLSKEAQEFISKNANLIEELAKGEKVIIDKKPSDALLVSMALRQNHAFGLTMQQNLDEKLQEGFNSLYPTEDQKRNMLIGLLQIYEEISGEGFYNKEREAYYLNMLPKGWKKPS